MRKVLLACALLFLITLSTPAQQARRTMTTTIAGNDIGINETGSGVAYHQLTWNVSGSVPTCQVRLMGSTDNVTFGTTIIANQTCTSNGQSALSVLTISNYVRIEVTTKTGTGSVTTTYLGYTAAPGGGGTITGGGASPQVAFWTGATALGGDSQFTWDTTGKTGYVGTPIASLDSFLQGIFGPAGTQTWQVSKKVTSGVVPITIAAINQNSSVAGSGGVGVYGVGFSDPDANVFETIGVEGNGISKPPVGRTYDHTIGVDAGVVQPAGSVGTTTMFAGTRGSIVVAAGTVTNAPDFWALNGGHTGGTIHNHFGYYSEDLHGVGDTLNAAFYNVSQGVGANDYAAYSLGGKHKFLGTTEVVLDVSESSTATPAGTVNISGVGTGDCSGFSDPCLLRLNQENGATFAFMVTNKAGAATDAGFMSISNTGAFQVGEQNAVNTHFIQFNADASIHIGNDSTGDGLAVSATSDATATKTMTSPVYKTATNCADSAGAAACGSAAAGSFVVDAAATTVVVSTTAVTANSEIFVQYDSSLGTRLGVTCNVTVALPVVTARTAGASFTMTVPVAPAVNPACYSYHIVN